MPKFVIERVIPDAGKLSQEDLVAISQKSCSVLDEMGPRSSGCKATSPTTALSAPTSRPTMIDPTTGGA